MDRVKEEIRENIIDCFRAIDLEKEELNGVQILKIEEEKDFDQVYYGPGFYLILTREKLDDIDSCQFKYTDFKVIYHGHSYFSKRRIMSHLANEHYNQNRHPRNPKYTVCLKMDNSGRNGININKESYNSYGWMVIVFKMKGSNRLIQEQAEHAFDEVYGKPCRSLEN